MNILLDSLPETMFVDGKELFFDTDYRTAIIFEKISLDSTLGKREKIKEIINLFFTDEKPKDIVAAVNGILDFYRCGEKPRRENDKKRMNGLVEIKPKMIYDYEYDAPYIFGAFMSQYKIDLNEIDYLHWWKFQSLFKSLNDSNKIVEIMGYRSADLGSISNKKERERIAKMKSIYALPDNLTAEDKVAMAGLAFGGGFI